MRMFKPVISRQFAQVFFALLIALSASPSRADCISDAVSCVVNAAKAQYYAVSSLGPVLAFTVKHPSCVQAIASQDYVSIGIMTTVSGIAASGQISSSEGGCKNDLYGKYAASLAQALASVIPVQSLADVASGKIAPELVAQTFNAVAPVPGVTTPQLLSLKDQIGCACAVASTGANAVEKIKLAINATGAAAKACGDTLSCLGGPAIKAIGAAAEVVGNSFYQTAKCVAGPNDCGESAPMTEEAYYRFYWEPFIPEYVDAWVTGSGVSNNTGSVYDYQNPTISKDEKFSRIWHECENYYLNHRYSGGILSTGDHAQRACDNMRDNRFLPAANAAYGSKMDNEIFPKKMQALIGTPQAKYQQACNIPNKAMGGLNKDGTVTITSDTGAETYGGLQSSFSDDCKKQINQILGLSPDNIVVGQPNSVIWEVKNTYKNNNYDIGGTLNKVLADGSKYDNELKKVAELKKTQIAVSGQLNEKTVLINKAYEKYGAMKWDEYRAKCPAKNSDPNAEASLARPMCIKDTADFIGVTLTLTSDAQHQDDLGSLNFNTWKTIPTVYKAALDGFAKAADAATQELAESRVQLAFGFAKQAMDNIAPDAIQAAKALRATMRQKQNAALEAQIEAMTQNYTDNLQKCQRQQCKDKLFKIWEDSYKYMTGKVTELGKGQDTVTPIPDSAFNFLSKHFTTYIAGNLSLYQKTVAEDKLEFSKAASEAFKNGAGTALDGKTVGDVGGTSLKNGGLGAMPKPQQSVADPSKGSLADSIRNQGADGQAGGNIGVAGGLGQGVLGGGVGQPLKRGQLGMRAPPAIGAVGSQAPGSQPPVGVVKQNDPATNQALVNGLPDSNTALDQQAVGIDPLNPASQQSRRRGMRAAPGMQKIGGEIAPPGDFSKQGVTGQMPAGGLAPGLAAGVNPGNTTGIGTNPGANSATSPADAKKPAVVGMTSAADQFKGPVVSNNPPGAGGMPKLDSPLAPPAPAGKPAAQAPITSNQPVQGAIQGLDSSKPLQAAAVPPSAPPPEPPFDRQRYQRMARQTLEAKWNPQCNNEPCKAGISNLIADRIREVLSMLDMGQDLRVKATYDTAELRMDYKYDPKMQDLVNQSRIIKNEAPSTPTPVAPPKTMKLKNFGVQ